jgi:hypothetical protein
MSKYCPENERVKRDYTFWLETSNGKQNATIDAALRAIERFEASTSLTGSHSGSFISSRHGPSALDSPKRPTPTTGH